MSCNDTRELAMKLMDFNFKLGHWKTKNYNKEFNINGKGNHDITTRQFSILFLVSKMGLSTITNVEEAFNISKSSLSLTVSKLVEEGYLRKERPKEDDDKRKTYFMITDKGQKSLDEVTERIIEMFNAFYLSLDLQQMDNLKQGIELLDGIFN